ncbi:Swarming motility protein SwrC [Fervidicola ferrireducens]|uniref:Swarming motility protein SwrC n=1 Tax=Fervidicola ferrireducens TaxID=520764 RepID=A0A140L8S4_9FIRM|nr:efflux RND transporter permease subunit [Fervidicola ferrireducens]KXG76949.1 Swarming motility protein SwrC [Fervidicola ferrireducens]
MRITETVVKRPVATLMAVLVIIILGFVSLSKMQVDLLPDIQLPTAVIVTTYPGASSEEIETMITKPIEKEIAGVENIKSISSSSEANVSMITVNFNWGTDLDTAVTDIREKVDMVKKRLPDDADEPIVIKFDPSMMPVLIYGMTGDRDPLLMKQIAEDMIEKRLERVAGVASVQVTGGVERQIRVLLSPQKMNGYGISFSQVIQALAANNLNLPGGTVDYGSRELIVRTTGEFENVDEIKNLPVANRQGAIVRLSDIADVKDATEDVKTHSRINKYEGLRILIQKSSDANTVAVANGVKKELEAIKKELPKGIELYQILDQSDFINRSINNVISSAIQGGLLAVIVLYLFLHNFRSTVVIAISIPISIIATFVVMYFSGITLNLISLGGLALGIGMLVDSSIVVLENIYHHRELGLGGMEAACVGAEEVTLAIVASTLTTIAVFLPIVFVKGMAGILFKEMSLTITFSLLSSLIVAITLVPLLSSRLVKVTSAEEKKQGFLARIFEGMDRFYDSVDEKYGKLLAWALRHRKIVILAIVGLLVISVMAVPLVGTEFFPETDEGRISIKIEYPLGTKVEKTDELVKSIENIVASIPEVQMYSSQVGTDTRRSFLGTTGSGEMASIDVRLVPVSERKRSTKDVVEEIRQKIGEVPGAKIEINSATTMSTIGSVSGMSGSSKPLQIAIKGDDFAILESLAEKVKTVVKKVPGTRDVETSVDEGRPEVRIKVDKDRASYYGLDASQVAQTVRIAINGVEATKYRVAGTEVEVNVQLDELSRKTLEDLEGMTLMSPSGVNVPLRSIAEFTITEGPNVINRVDQKRVVYVTADIYKRSLGEVTNDIKLALSSINLPEGYSISFEGQNKEMMESFADLFQALLLAVFLVYAVMAAQFESLLHPFTIMFAIPFCTTGVVFGLLISRRAFSVPAFIGVIMLAGIAVNNAIVLVDYINQLRAKGKTVREAIVEAGPRRLRPIMMTTLTTVLGLLPLALGIGEGSEIQAPLAVTVMGGLSVSTLLTLVVVPVLYSIFEDLSAMVVRRVNIFKQKLGRNLI